MLCMCLFYKIHINSNKHGYSVVQQLSTGIFEVFGKREVAQWDLTLGLPGSLQLWDDYQTI